jgi:hypothetical protein
MIIYGSPGSDDFNLVTTGPTHPLTAKIDPPPLKWSALRWADYRYPDCRISERSS